MQSVTPLSPFDSAQSDTHHRAGPLLYVADTRLIRVYAYPEGKLVGTLKQENYPDGECANPNTGDIFITEQDEIVEYAHGGTSPIEILNFPDSGSYSCSVDSRSSNLAVTDADYPGGLYVYPHGSGTPKLYDIPGVGITDCVYDGRGDLFITGNNFSGVFALEELSNKGALFAISLGATPTKLKQTAGVQWDGRHVVLSDGAQNLYWFKIVRHAGVLAGQATLENAENVHGMWLEGNRLIVPGGPYYDGTVAFYDYPTGGAPVKTMRGFYRPFAATISVASK